MEKKTTTYTIIRLQYPSDFTEEVKKYFREESPKLAEMFGNSFNYKNCSLFDMAKRYCFLICKRNNEIRGHMIFFIGKSIFDPKKIIAEQITFYVKPDSGRTAYHLFHKFIDIGKSKANHIITMLTSHTNIKPSTLKKMGFSELETLYRMEVSLEQ